MVALPMNMRLTEGQDRTQHRVALTLAVLLPWMLLVARAGAEIATAVIGLLFLWRSMVMRDWAWLHEPFVRLGLVAWVWLMFVVSPFAINPEKSFMLALPWGRYILLFVALRYWLLTTRQALIAVVISLAVLVGFCVVDALVQYVTGMSLTQHPRLETGRLTGPFRTPKVGIFIARFLLPMVSILTLLQLKKPLRWRALFLGGALVCVAAIMCTGERTAFTMTLVSLNLVLFLVSLGNGKIRLHALMTLALLLTATVLLFLTQNSIQMTFLRTVDHLEHFHDSPYGQVSAAAIETGREYWPTGAGIQGFRIVTERLSHLQVKELTIKEPFSHPHNVYLEWFAEAGFGVVLYTAMVLCLLYEAIRMLLRSHGGMEVIAPAFMVSGWVFYFFPLMSMQSYFSNWTAIMVWYCLGILFSVRVLTAASERT